MGIRCPMCGGEPPAHFEDCPSVERRAQAAREREMERKMKAEPEETEEKQEPQPMPVLFIGGPHDGDRLPMTDLPPVYQATYPNPDFNAARRVEDAYEAEPAYLIAPYRREAFKCPAGLYPVYVFHNIPQQDVVHLLLEGYKCPSVAVN